MTIRFSNGSTAQYPFQFAHSERERERPKASDIRTWHILSCINILQTSIPQNRITSCHMHHVFHMGNLNIWKGSETKKKLTRAGLLSWNLGNHIYICANLSFCTWTNVSLTHFTHSPLHPCGARNRTHINTWFWCSSYHSDRGQLP